MIGGLLCISINKPEYKIIGLFFMFVCLMQGIDYLAWSHQVCDDYNKTISKLAMIINHLQPVILCLLLYIYSRDKFNENKHIILPLIAFYVVVVTIYSLSYTQGCILKDKSTNHLEYSWNSLNYSKLVYTLFLLCFVVFGFFFPENSLGKSFSFYAILSYLISRIIYNDTPVVGNMWCFFAAFGPMLYYMYYKFKN